MKLLISPYSTEVRLCADHVTTTPRPSTFPIKHSKSRLSAFFLSSFLQPADGETSPANWAQFGIYNLQAAVGPSGDPWRCHYQRDVNVSNGARLDGRDAIGCSAREAAPCVLRNPASIGGARKGAAAFLTAGGVDRLRISATRSHAAPPLTPAA
ncbi:hypothetical protein FQA47_004272 [Oryzias melastigma]|uniref:Uncharacterized protein n=1 Tax=Oryzias melastigma TaxID=30732 RepID=A0A834C9G4_ORYME|nr:hypothetical protein FQA47_004272 [Oryzias melastigma]